MTVRKKTFENIVGSGENAGYQEAYVMAMIISGTYPLVHVSIHLFTNICFAYSFSFATTVFNALPNDKILDVTKFKACADDKLSIVKMMISLYDDFSLWKTEKMLVTSIFPLCFPKPSSLASSKVRIVW